MSKLTFCLIPLIIIFSFFPKSPTQICPSFTILCCTPALCFGRNSCSPRPQHWARPWHPWHPNRLPQLRPISANCVTMRSRQRRSTTLAAPAAVSGCCRRMRRCLSIWAPSSAWVLTPWSRSTITTRAAAAVGAAAAMAACAAAVSVMRSHCS